MDNATFDVIVIGAGIAGASAAAWLAADHRVALLEAEDAAGYHTTGRSAAMWLQNYGPPDVRRLARLSRDFLEHPPAGFTSHPLHHPRAVVFLAPPTQTAHLAAMLAESTGVRAIEVSEVRAIVPALRPDYAVAAAIEEDAFDMDVAALHQGYLGTLRSHGGVLALQRRIDRIERHHGAWHAHAGDHRFSAPILINAAGAWGDDIAASAGVAPVGLSPRRRTGVIINPAPWQPGDWPMVNDVDHSWYVRPEARTRLMVSPADETPMHPHDVQPDELDVAIAIDRMQQALDIPVSRVERSWAGLRTFTPDRNLAIGWDGDAEGFFWCVGQGGYGIQTSPAAGRLIADVIGGRDPGEAGAVLAGMDPRRFRREESRKKVDNSALEPPREAVEGAAAPRPL